MATSTGSPVLDDALDGGFPDGRTVLATGGPGTGKSTLGMQFVQQGLSEGESCLYVSTEQTLDELADSFASHDFDLDHENLTVTSIHASPGSTIEDEEELVLDTLGGEEDEERSFGGQFNAPFTGEYVSRFLERYAPADRIVFDSASGLRPMAAGDRPFRQGILDLVRLFADEFEATTLLTAEGSDAEVTDVLEFTTHGVLRLWREDVGGDIHHYVQVEKMRGVDHDRQPFEFDFTDGFTVYPRTTASAGVETGVLSTGVPGLDDLAGGGLRKGGTVVLEHDGRASVDEIVVRTTAEALADGMRPVLFPSPNLGLEKLDLLLGDRWTVTDLLDDDRLFVLDWFDTWDVAHRNVIPIHSGLLRDFMLSLRPYRMWKLMRVFSEVSDRREDDPVFPIVYTETILQTVLASEVRTLLYAAKSQLLEGEDTILFVQNPGVMEEEVAEFYVYDAQQVFKTWTRESGLQYVRLEKSPQGKVGASRLVTHDDSPPFVRVQRSRSD